MEQRENAGRLEQQKIIDYLGSFISDNKKHKIAEVLAWRTRFFTVVLENIYHAQNASAVMRTSECLGIQDVHVIDDNGEYKINPMVTRGSTKWLSVYKYNQQNQDNTALCLENLKSSGYQIMATALSAQAQTLYECPLHDKIAFVFGNEEMGVSATVQQQADVLVKIPMYGFTQSYNVSVSAAVILSYFVRLLHQSDLSWQLTSQEQQELMLTWYRKVLRRSHRSLEKRLGGGQREV